MLKFEAVRKAYDHHLILSIPSQQLDPGIFWLKGSNGAGKSTLLKMIAGMIPFEGEITLADVPLRARPVAYRRLVNYIEAEPLYPPFLTGSDLIHFVQSARKADVAQAKHLCDKMSVVGFAGNPVNTYSSGMVKRLSLVLAFIGQPKLILLDEPLVTIDKETIPLLYDLIREGAGNGINFIVASHQPLEAGLLPPFRELQIRDHELLAV